MIEYVAPEPAAAASPCVNICRIDPASGWCEGCGRSLAEIAGWSAATVAQKLAINAALPARMAVLGG